MYEKDFTAEKGIRKNKIVNELQANNVDAMLLTDSANLYYTSGRVFSGYTYINKDGKELFFVKKPVGLKGDDVVYIRKQEDIPDKLLSLGMAIPSSLALEFNTLAYSDVIRIQAIFPQAKHVNASSILRKVRSTKTSFEVSKIRESGLHHAAAYHKISKIYQPGMTDIELQIEIERQLRLEGSLGQFRVSGQSMEIFMGSVISGSNADAPTPYDFAMGGAGLHPSLPVGCNGSLIKPGETIMVDMGGDFTGYMTDMSRTFYVGKLPEIAYKAHQLSIDIVHSIATKAQTGVATRDLYDIALGMATDNEMLEYFMGYSQHAGFIGHGIGIEINEAPVLAPRSKDILEAGNVIAVEPKFVIPKVGAVGIENTYLVTDTGLECLTNFLEPMTELY